MISFLSYRILRDLQRRCKKLYDPFYMPVGIELRGGHWEVFLAGPKIWITTTDFLKGDLNDTTRSRTR